jgi:hypothetical protein
MIRIIALVALLSLHSVCPAAVQDVAGQNVLLAGKRITNPLLGISFIAPEGWNIENLDNGCNLYHAAQKSNVLIMATTYCTREQLLSAAREIMDDGNGTRLAPTGEPVLFSDNGVQAEYVGTWRGVEAGVMAIGLLSPNSGGMMILAVSDKAHYGDSHKTLAQSLARSLAFLKPETTADSQVLQNRFAGKKLTYLSSYSSGASGGYVSQRFISLCPDGQFVLTGNSSVSMEAAGASGHSSGVENAQGLWKVAAAGGQSVLLLNATDGSVRSYVIKIENNALYLEGRRYFITDDADCR